MSKSEGAPRKTTTYNTFGGMDTQNERYGVEKEFFFWLENIMWVGPHKLHSVPGPRAIATMPPPPPPIETPSCPPEPVLVHIDEGFSNIFIGTVVIDQTNLVAYYAGTIGAGQWITKFDMVGLDVPWDTQASGKKWYQPGVDPTNGDVYVRDLTTSGINAISQISPVDGTLIRTSGTLGGFNLTPKITANTIYIAFSSSGINFLAAVNKSDLLMRWSTVTPGTALGVGNRISGICVDSNDDVWIHTHQSGSVGANRNTLIQFDETTGAGTAHDISSAIPAGTFQNIAFDPINNTIIASGGGTAKFELSGFAVTLINATSLLDTGSGINGIIDGKIWFNQASNLQEYSAVDGSLLQTISKGDIVLTNGPTVTSWADIVMLLSLNCLHLNHGSFPAAPIGGVDRLCLPC